MYNQNLSQNNQSNLKTILIIHLALMTGQAVFAVLCLVIIPSKGFSFNTGDVFDLVAVILTTGAFVLSTFLYRTQLNTALGKATAKEKLLNYSSAIIMRDAPLEGASLFCIVAYMQTGNTLFIGISAIIILYFVLAIPTKTGC